MKEWNSKQTVFMNAISVLESENKYLEAFDYVEQMAELLKGNTISSKTANLEDFLQQKLNGINRQTNELCKLGNQNGAIKLMQRASNLIELYSFQNKFAPIMVSFQNSMAAIYKETKRNFLALKSLETAILIATKNGLNDNMGITHMNLSEILSLAGNLSEAHAETEKAINCTKKDLANPTQNGEKHRDTKLVKEKQSLLGLIYYNAGTQEEKIGKFESAHANYQKAQELIENNNNEADSLLLEKIKKAEFNLMEKTKRKVANTPKADKKNIGFKIELHRRHNSSKQTNGLPSILPQDKRPKKSVEKQEKDRTQLNKYIKKSKSNSMIRLETKNYLIEILQKT